MEADINAIVEQLLQTGELMATNGYQAALKHVYASAFTSLGLSVPILGVIPYFAKKVWILAAKADKSNEIMADIDGFLIRSISGTALALVTLMLLSICQSSITNLIAPEWAAMNELLSAIK